MGPSSARVSQRSQVPWENESPPLDALEGSEGQDEEMAWYRTMLFIEDMWATAVDVSAPDAEDVSVRLRPLMARLMRHVSDGFSRLPLDDLQRASIFLGPPLRSIVDRPNTRLTRTHEHIPWERVDELDARSLLWMSRLPGRTMREKSATTRRALGIVRAHTLEVAENRVLVRLARDLLPWLERRIEAIKHLDARPGERSRQEALLSLGRLLRDELPKSPFGAVRPAIRPEANNALLGSGRYGQVWRAWRWLNLRQSRFADLWRGGTQLVHCALGLLVAGRLRGCGDAFLVDDFSTVRLGGDRFRMGLDEVVSVDVLLADKSPRSVSIAMPSDGQPLQIVTTNAQTGLVLSSLSVEVGFDQAGLGQRRGCPVRVSWADFDHDILGQTKGWFDADGIEGLLRPLVALLHPGDEKAAPRILVAGASQGDDCVDARQLLAADLGAVAPVLADDTCTVTNGASCVAIDFQIDDERIHRVMGEDALAMQSSREATARFSLSSTWDAVASGDCPVADLASALIPLFAGTPHHDCELCVPVPDGLGEPGEALLRAALPSEFRRVWLVPRAAAAALALRAEDPGEVAVDEPLLVLDCGPLGFEARLVVLRRVTDESGPDPYMWECPLPWAERPEGKAGATRAFWLQVARDALGPDIAQDYVERVIDSGLIVRIANDPQGRPGACLFGGKGQLGPLLYVHTNLLEAAAHSLGVRFREWLASLAQMGALDEARAQAGTRRLHVLIVGEPLSLAPVGVALRGACMALLPDAVLHVPSTSAMIATGGLEFLQRNQEGSPTFELALPDLYLMAIDSTGAAISQPIFHKQKVRPGAEVPVKPMPFELPAGVPTIELPLEREPGGRRPLAFRAVLEGEGLPLRLPLRVDLQVVYRYAEDGFRILIRPRRVNETSVAFADREVRWLRADARADDCPLKNDPPQFPQPLPPAELSPEDATSVRSSIQAFKEESDDFLNNYAIRRQGTGERDFMRRLDQATRVVTRLSVGDPAQALDRAIERTLVDDWVVPLCLLADVSSDPPYPKRRVPPWASKASEIRKHSPSLIGAARAALSRLRGRAPRGVHQALLNDAERHSRLGKPLDEEQLKSLGRTINALAPTERSPALIRFIEIIRALRNDPSKDFGMWWALASMLWSDAPRVRELAATDVAFLLERVERALEDRSASRLDRFQEIGIVLLALLRRRGLGDAGPVDAGSPRLRRLADRIDDIERAFVSQGKRREPRLKLADQDEGRKDVSVFVDALTAALRGERVALIRAMEED